MAISFVGAGTVGTGSTAPVAGLPSGVVAGDLLIVAATGNRTVSVPTGWTQIASQGAGAQLQIFFKFATASETSVTVSGYTTSSAAAVMVAYRGAGAYQVVPAYTSGASTTATPNTLTTTYANDYILNFYAAVAATGTATWTANASTTSRANSSVTSTSNGLLVADELKATAGVTTARAATLSASRTWGSIAIGFIPSRTVYWVGGAGTWNAAGTTNWADTSGGAGGKVAPSLGDDVVVDDSSGSPTISISAATCKSLTTTGATCTITSTGTINVGGSMTLSATTTWSATGALTFLYTGTLTTNAVTIQSPITFNGPSQTFTLSGNLTSNKALTYTAGTLTLADNTLSCLTFTATATNTRSITFGTGAITVTGTGTVFNVDGTNLTRTGTPTVNISNNSATATTVTAVTGFTSANRFNFNFTTGTYTLTLTTGASVGILNFTGFSGTWTSTGTVAYTVYGDITFSTGMTLNLSSTTTVTIGASCTVTSNGKSSTATMSMGALGSTLQFADNFSWGALTHSAGVIDGGTVNKTLGLFTSNSGTPRTLTMGSGTWTITGGANTNIWAVDSAFLTYNQGTANIVLNMSTTNAKTFAGGGLTYNNLTINGTAAFTLTMTGANTFSTFTNNATAAWTLKLPASTTTTVSTISFNKTGASGAITLNSSTAGTAATLSQATGTVNVQSLTIQDSTVTGGATWNAYNSTNVSNNTGWNFLTLTALYWVGGSGTLSSFGNTNWALTSGGAATSFNTDSTTDAYIDGNSGSPTITLANSPVCKSFITTGSTCTIAGNVALGLYGSLTLSTTTTWSSSNTITFNGTGTVTTTGVTFSSVAFTINAPSNTVTLANSVDIGSILTLTSGTLALNDNTITCSSFASANSNTRVIQFGTGEITAQAGGINITATNLTCSGSKNINVIATGSTGTTVTLASFTETNALNLHVGTSNNYLLTMPTGNVFKSLDFTDFTGRFTPTTQTYTLYGSLTLASGMTFTAGTGAITFANTSGTAVITTNGKTLNQISINAPGGTVQLADNLTIATGNPGLLAGTFDANDKNVTVPVFSSSNSTTRSLIMGSGTWTLTGTGTVWGLALTTNLTFDAGTSTIVLSNTTTTARTFAGGGLTYNNLTIGGATGISTLTFTGNNTFNTISSTKTVAHTILLPVGGTTTVSNWTVSGTAGNPVSITSNASGNQSTLAKAGGGVVSGIDYLLIRDSIASPGSTWYAGANSTNISNNTGWIFGAYSANTNFLFLF